MKKMERMEEALKEGFLTQEDFINTLKAEKIWAEKTTKRTEWDANTKTANKHYYYEIPAAFDIETTGDSETKTSYMYIWQLCINGHSTSGRTWAEFGDLLNSLIRVMFLGARVLVIYVHNLGYEMSFMMPRLADGSYTYFAKGEHEPLKVALNAGIEFRDSAALSGLSLAKTAENLTKFKIEKMTGDLDYTKPRNSLTPLAENELNYCLHDVTALSAYIWEQMEIYGSITKIPLTNTGRVRLYMREHCLFTEDTDKNGKKKANKKFRETMKSLTIQPGEYQMLQRAYTGGYTHAAHMYNGEIVQNITSKDFTSSYPTVMVSEKFPMSAGEEVYYKTWKEWQADRDAGYLIMSLIEVSDIKGDKFTYEHYLSISKAINASAERLTDNGRIVYLKHGYYILTDIDIDIMRATYSGSAKLLKSYRYRAGYLPPEIIRCVLELYQAKTTLKGIKGAEAEYQLKKGMLNSIYGMEGTDIIQAKTWYEPGTGWHTWPNAATTPEEAKTYVCEELEKYNKSTGRITFFPWAVWITAYARRNLWDGIQELKEDYIYSDTDSVKAKNYEQHSGYFSRYNEAIQRKIKAVCSMYGIPEEMAEPQNERGEKKPLGIWDDDGTYKRFKTLGAKRYITEDGTGALHITIAGIGKITGGDYIASTKDPFNFFSYGMKVPPDYSGKLACSYSEAETRAIITDEQGNSEEMAEKGGAYLYPTEYLMTIGREYKEYLDLMHGGTTDLNKVIAQMFGRACL